MQNVLISGSIFYSSTRKDSDQNQVGVHVVEGGVVSVNTEEPSWSIYLYCCVLQFLRYADICEINLACKII